MSKQCNPEKHTKLTRWSENAFPAKPRVTRTLEIHFLLLSVDDAKQLLAFGGIGEILVTVLRDQNVILDADAADGIVLFQDVLVDVARVGFAVEEVALNILTAKVTANLSVSWVGTRIRGPAYIPGSTVTIMFFSRRWRPL